MSDHERKSRKGTLARGVATGKSSKPRNPLCDFCTKRKWKRKEAPRSNPLSWCSFVSSPRVLYHQCRSPLYLLELHAGGMNSSPRHCGISADNPDGTVQERQSTTVHFQTRPVNCTSQRYALRIPVRDQLGLQRRSEVVFLLISIVGKRCAIHVRVDLAGTRDTLIGK